MRRLRRGMLLVGLIVAFGAPTRGSAETPAFPRLWEVCPSGCDFPTIQAAVNGVASGDGIIVDAGTYAGFGDPTKNLTISGSGVVTISGGGPVVTVGSSGAASQPTVTLQNVTIDNGSSVELAGGIVNYGTLTVNNSAIASNVSSTSGANPHGGGIDNFGALSIQNSTITGNTSTSSFLAAGGGIYNAGTSFFVTNSIIKDNDADSSFAPGGSIAADGPGIYNAAGSSGTVTNSAIHDNLAGTFFGPNSSDGAGGGIYNAGNLIVTNTTINANHTDYGGGVWQQSGSLTLANSTVSGDHAVNGGGIYVNGGSLVLTNSTVAANLADSTGGGFSSPAGTTSLANTLLAGNQATSGAGPDCSTNGISDAPGGHNLVGNNYFCNGLTNGTNGDQVGTPASPIDPKLDPNGLQSNGGPTQTIALLPTSPAVDAGDNAPCSGYPVNSLDQRGIARPFSSSCDIGAFELMGLEVPISVGWNVLDLPIADFSDSSRSGLTAALDTQLGAGTVRMLATYGGGRFSLFVPGYSPDATLSPSTGIFMLSSHAGTWNGFQMAGSAFYYTAGQTVTLHPGWNLVAAPYPRGGLTTAAIASQLDPACAPGPCSVKEIAGYSAGGYTAYVPGGAGTNFTVPATSGMWIDMEYGESWTPH